MSDKVEHIYRKKTKIVSTLGPSTDSREVLEKMMECGVDIFRVNFSHADYEKVKERIKLIREINEERGFNVGILADLQGPKLRIGEMEDAIEIEPGDELLFTNEPTKGNKDRVYMNYKQFPRDVKKGEQILIDDGKIILEVLETNLEDQVRAKVIQGGPLKSKKGVNLPNTKISLPALTEKDVADAKFAISQDVDWFALSFVRNADDIKKLKDIIHEDSFHYIPIISKIEKPEALENIDEILAECDGLMVARGDLGVEIPFEAVPLAQKMLIDKAKLANKPTIVATQLMETMTHSLTPTRAEVNDVANAVIDGSDAVMLSGETSVGDYPIQVVQKMTKIIQTVEDDDHAGVPANRPKDKNHERFVTNIICYNASKLANQSGAKAISTITQSGYTAFQISSQRPNAYILVFTSNRRIIPMLNLLWGVKAFFHEALLSTDETVVEVNKQAHREKYVEKGDFVVNLNAMPVFDRGITNTLRLSVI